MEITYSKIETVFNFIRKSVYELENKGIHVTEIKVLIPNFFKRTIQTYYEHTLPLDNKHNRIFDVEIVPHYKNEIVVFHENFFKNHDNVRILNIEI